MKITTDKMRQCGQACAFCGKYLGMAGNVWCYEQVCLAEMFKFSTNVIGKLAYSTCYVPFFYSRI